MGKDEPSAGDDFYRHVNSAWLNDPNVVIPPEYPRFGSFIKLVDEAFHNQIKLMNDLAAQENLSEDEVKLNLIWKASMKRFRDWEEGKGDYSSILKEFGVLEEHFQADDVENFAKYFSRCQEIGITYPFGFGKEANFESSNDIIVDLGPSGLSLPSRDHYLSEKFTEQLTWFKAHLENVVALVGKDNLQDDFTSRVVRFETKLAHIMMTPEQQRQYDQYYTVTSIDDLITKMNELNALKDKSTNYGDNPGIEGEDRSRRVLCSADFCLEQDELDKMKKLLNHMYECLNLREQLSANYKKNYPDGNAADAQFRAITFDGDYLRRIFALLLDAEEKTDLKAFLQYKIIRFAGDYCTKDLNEEIFDFYSRKLRGQKEQKSAEKRTVNLVNDWVGELMGKIYVLHHFQEKDKQIILGMVNDILDIMSDSIKDNDWLTEPTKKKALEKLSHVKVKIGYPDKWKDYASLSLCEGDDLFEMQRKVNRFEHRTEFLEKVNTLKDPTKWEMHPQQVNAYFHPLNNEIVFPAAILQPPFYLKTLDEIDFETGDVEMCKQDPESVLRAINHGGILAVISHELTHGYDDQGRKFDHAGNIKDWWAEEDSELFKSKCKVMGEQAAAWKFEMKEDSGETNEHKMSPELTMGENLADLGGLSLSSQALEKYFKGKGKGSEEIDALLRIFFRSWANIWKCKQTDAFTINQLATDPHAPTSFRANLVSNIENFYRVFGIKEADPMFLTEDKRVKMW